jgi:hypothetical protein
LCAARKLRASTTIVLSARTPEMNLCPSGRLLLLTLLASALLILSATSLCQAVFTPVAYVSSSAAWSPRQAFATWTYNNSIYLAGGVANVAMTAAVNDVWASPNGGITWIAQTNLTGAGVYGSAAVSFRDQFFILGGRPSAGPDSAVVYRSKATTTLEWTTSAAQWSPRAFAMAAVWSPPSTSGLSQQIILVGGTSNGVGYFSDVWSLSSPAGKWRLLGDFPQPLCVAGITSILGGSRIVIAGGSTGGSLSEAVYIGVWVSGAAPTWLLLTASAGWTARLVTLEDTANDYLYLINGDNAPAPARPTYSNDVRAQNHACTQMLLCTARSLLCMCHMLVLLWDTVSVHFRFGPGE